jgi:hypothetical protein
MDSDAIEAALLLTNQRCDPPLPEQEVRRIAQSISRYEPAANPKIEIDRLTQNLTADTPTIAKLKALLPLVPTLAKMSNLEAAAIIEELRERLQLRAKDLNGLAADVRAARKVREAKSTGGGPTPALSDLEENRRLHPAIDFLGEAMSIGFRVDLPDNETGLLLVFSDGQEVRTEINPEMLQAGEQAYQIPKKSSPPFLRDVWGLKELRKFLEHPTRPNNLYGDLVAAYKTYLDLPDAAYGLLAAWTVGTSFAHLVTAFPFLHFHGPKESGKSKTLEALRCVCLNAWKGRDITAAALGDTADGQRGTLLLDQAEKLNNEENGNLIGLLADSYKKAGGQRRVVEITKAGRSVLEFSTYGPKAFASTKPLDPDLADRCVRIPMTRTRKRLPDLEGWEPVWKGLRDELYRYTLAAFKEVRQHYETIPGDGTRIGELWRPLLAVLLALGVEQSEIEAIYTLFMEAAQETRHEPTGWECTLLEVLREEAQARIGRFEMTVSEITTAMNIEGDKQPGHRWVGETITRYHLHKERTRQWRDGKYLTTYSFDPKAVIEKCEIYLRYSPKSTCSPVQDAETVNNSDGYNEHTQKSEHVQDCSRAENEDSDSGNEQTCTCSPKSTCSPETIEITDNKQVEQSEQAKSGGIEKKYSHFFNGEVDL